MKVRNISIENFQSYYGVQSLSFSDKLNLIIGNGGKGKSKLFNSFYWVLFGKIYITEIGWCSTDTLPHSAKFLMQRHDFVNKKALFEATQNQDIKTSVVIEFEDDKGLIYQIERSVLTHRISNGDWKDKETWTVEDNVLKVSHETTNGTQVKVGVLATDLINKLFPEGIRNYIWFQGESLDSLINFKDKETLKAAVKHISYFPYYETLSKIISLSSSRIAKNESKAQAAANKDNTELRRLVSEKERLQRNIDRELQTKRDLEDGIETIKLALTEGEQKMKGLASFSSLVARYKTCENDINKLSAEIDSLDKIQRSKLPNLWVLRGIEVMINKSKEIIEHHKEEENTMPEKKYLDNPSKAKLEEILRDGKCFVCGSDTSKGTPAHNYILERIKAQEEYLKELEDYTNNLQFNKQFNMFVGKIQDYPDSLSLSLSQIDKQYSESEDKIEKLLASRRKKNDEKTKLDNEIEDAKKKTGTDPVRDAHTANLVGNNIKASRSNLEREERKLRTCEEAISSYKSELKVIERDLEKLGSRGTIVSVPETEWKKISFLLEVICKKVQEKARKDLLKKIETRANEYYVRFTEHDKGYKGFVKIGDDYSIEFDPGLNTSHEDRKKMSIINALLSLNQEAMSIYYPFISDAPTSSFDLESTYNYLNGIKDIFHQSIIMTKDVDMNSSNYQNLISQSSVSKVFVLDSEIFTDSVDPEIHEVSTKINQIK